jgi:hypothetical protein
MRRGGRGAKVSVVPAAEAARTVLSGRGLAHLPLAPPSPWHVWLGIMPGPQRADGTPSQPDNLPWVPLPPPPGDGGGPQPGVV